MSRIIIAARSEDDTISAGERLGRVLRPGDVVCLYGELGAGKTTFIKGIARAAGIPEGEITSASFVIISEHYGRCPLYHIDLYRTEGESDIQGLGLEEYLSSDGITVIEWTERLGDTECSFSVMISYSERDGREIAITGSQERLKAVSMTV